MAFSTTTLNGAVTADQSTVLVTSATGFAAGLLFKLDAEMCEVLDSYVAGNLTVPCARGREGTASAAHPTAARITVGQGADWSALAVGAVSSFPVAGISRIVTSYSATGAITLPPPGNDAVALLNGTSALAMTLAAPTADMDGCFLWIVGGGKSASTVTFTGGFGAAGASYDVITFQNAGQVTLPLVAANSLWNILNTPITGTSTSLSVAIA